jgi:hypothetical protein
LRPLSLLYIFAGQYRSARTKVGGMPRGPVLSTSRKEHFMNAGLDRRQLLFLGLVSAGLVLAGLGLWVVPSPASPRPFDRTQSPMSNGLVVHEWGTFLSVQGSNGATLGGMIDSEEKLPQFVRERDLNGRNRAYMFNKMETPVTYFYTDHPMTAEVRVEMPRGLLTHWFPAVQAFGPPTGPAARPVSSASFLDWGKVELFPDTPAFVGLNKPVHGVRTGAAGDSTWRFARETDSALVRVMKAPARVRPEGDVEKFLFYRGLGEFDLPLSVESAGTADDVKLTLHNRGPERLTALFAVRVRGGSIQYAGLPDLAGQSNLTISTASNFSTWMPQEDGVRQVKQQLTAALAKKGLFAREALAMTNTWESSYFHNEGLRILYVLPRRLVDELIPIQIKPAPVQLERVMVGRVEVLTPAQESDLLLQVANLKSADKKVRDAAQIALDRLGRLKEPALRRLLAISTNRDQIEQIESLIRALMPKAAAKS